MWEIIYDLLTKVVLYSTIALGTVERILDGKGKKTDPLAIYNSFIKLAKLSANLYMVLRIYLRKTREPYRCYYKFSADRYKVGGIGLITDHAVVSNAYIPLMEGIALVAEALFKNKLVDKFYRKQKTFGMYHIGSKMYAGRAVAMHLATSPHEVYKFLIANPHVIGEQIHVIIHETYVEVYFKKSIKKGESVITTNPPLGELPGNYDTVLSASPTSQNPVNVLS